MTTRALVIAPHHDDEVLGVGGSISKLASAGIEVHVVVVTKGGPPLFDPAWIEDLREEAKAANERLGVAEMHFLDFEAARLDLVPHSEVNAALTDVVKRLKPGIAYVPFVGDIHMDHQLVYQSSLVALRPTPSYSPTEILAYETLSETNWGGSYLTPDFAPNVFVDITDHLQAKLDAMRLYASQVQPFPHERSLEALEALACLRGSAVGVPAAEAFVSVRRLIR